ncbi:transcriptional regulator [Sinorhizobium sp. 8-89]|uniref:HVO_A0114 family putative DNA-binding protein n=1 Tax=Sinorhizobium sp. 8-89 TaxID=3049089 RepID=UPI0028681CF6|nr:transcriptional regulator [Sinorhizobium sp. 8-89]
MTTLHVRLGGGIDEMRQQFIETAKRIDAGENVPDAESSYYFGSYDDMHRILTPSRLAIVVTLAGQGPLSIHEVARRVNRDVEAVKGDVTTLINTGVIDRTADGVEFPYDRIHFEWSAGDQRE